MGFFTKDAAAAPGSSEGLTPLSKDRVKAALERESYNYGVDEDGDIGAGWEFGGFYFFVNGENDDMLSVRGQWRGKLEDADLAKAVEHCNTWNADRLWPKVYTRADNEGRTLVYTELNVIYSNGVSDGQIDQHIDCALNTSMSFFESLNEAFPAVWEQYKPEE